MCSTAVSWLRTRRTDYGGFLQGELSNRRERYYPRDFVGLSDQTRDGARALLRHLRRTTVTRVSLSLWRCRGYGMVVSVRRVRFCTRQPHHSSWAVTSRYSCFGGLVRLPLSLAAPFSSSSPFPLSSSLFPVARAASQRRSSSFSSGYIWAAQRQ